MQNSLSAGTGAHAHTLIVFTVESRGMAGKVVFSYNYAYILITQKCIQEYPEIIYS